MYAAAALGLAYILFRAGGKRRRKDPLADSPVRFGMSQQKSVEREMQSLLVELSEMSRQITAQLDTRSTKLEILLREADDKIAELRALSTAAPGEARSTESFTPPAAPSALDDDPRHASVYRLADQGMPSQQIATELGRPNGEVELILALRGKRD